MTYKKTYLEDVLAGGSPLKKPCFPGKKGKACRDAKKFDRNARNSTSDSTTEYPDPLPRLPNGDWDYETYGAPEKKGPIEKKCPKGRAGKDCRKEKLKDAGRKAAVAVGGATLIHLGMGGYKKGDGDWVKKEGPIQKICPPGKKGKACRDAKKKKKYSSDDFTDDTPHKARVWDNQLEKDYMPLKKICPLGTKGAECRAKKNSKSHAWSFKSKKGRHLRGNI